MTYWPYTIETSALASLQMLEEFPYGPVAMQVQYIPIATRMLLC